jgi:predicted ATPase
MVRRVKPYLLHASFKPDVEFDFDSYPFSVPAVRELENIKFHPNVTFFVGENGSGKSTVLEALAVALGFGPEGGTKRVRFSTVDAVSPLHDALRIAKGAQPKDGCFLRAESFFNVASYMDSTGYVSGYGGALHERTHGAAFMAVLVHQLRGNAIYLLDEPEAAHSPNRQLATGNWQPETGNWQRSVPSTRGWRIIRSSSLPRIHQCGCPVPMPRSFCSTVPV